MSYWVNSPPKLEPVVPVGLPVEVGLADAAALPGTGVLMTPLPPGPPDSSPGNPASGRLAVKSGSAVQAVGVGPVLDDRVVVRQRRRPAIGRRELPGASVRKLLISSSSIGKLLKSNRKSSRLMHEPAERIAARPLALRVSGPTIVWSCWYEK